MDSGGGVNLLRGYLQRFSSLHRNRNPKRGYAPHKAVFLLALLDEVERGQIRENLVRVTPSLVATFRAYWRALVPAGTWRERMVYPFRYLVQDGFWQLVKDGVELTPKELGDPTSIGQLIDVIDGGRFTLDLWRLLQDRTAIAALRQCLLSTYFEASMVDLREVLPVAPVDYEIERLVAEAHARFQPRGVRETADDDGYYIRHVLFPRVVKGLYQESCAVCGLDTHTDKSRGIIDAAHILPFREFHNDDPRNGIALCKNHHWGFDAGWFSVGEDYELLVSLRLVRSEVFVDPGSRLHLPEDGRYAPAAEALEWHRGNVFLG